MHAAPAAASLRPGDCRTECSFCGTPLEDRAGTAVVAVPSNVRAFKHEIFHVWRCRECRSLHCLEVVDLARYYVNYPIPRALTWVVRVGFENQLRRLTAHGLTRETSLLDYGCGYGLFLEFLREHGYTKITGYDPYSAIERYRNPAALDAQYDVIVLQDVIEHVEDPRALTRELDGLLAPGGSILVGTPAAEHLSLDDPMKYWMQLHPPYHLHIYTREALEALGQERGWKAIGYFDRPYYDTPRFGLNARSADKFKWFHDGTLDSFQEPVASRRLWRSPRYVFLAAFGYWIKRRGEMAMVFGKPARTGGTRAFGGRS